LFRLLMIATLICCPVYSFALDYPPPLKQRVNDYAGILSAQEKEELELMLSRHETDTSNQIVVAIFPSLEQESLEDFVNRLFERWGIGQKVNNNGVLLAIFLKEKKIRIEVGYGLEGRLTDALSSRIIRDEIAPEFRTGRYATGIRAGLQAIQKAIAGEYKPLVRPQEPGNQFLSSGTIFILVMVFLYIFYRIRNQAMYLPGDSYTQRHRRRRDNDWFIFPGGGWGSGGGGWGGGGGGGFGGGGGMSGGGGASGSW
jgi:uncharacterized protein